MSNNVLVTQLVQAHADYAKLSWVMLQLVQAAINHNNTFRGLFCADLLPYTAVGILVKGYSGLQVTFVTLNTVGYAI